MSADSTIETIISLIRTLSPEARRRLQQRLRVSGLLVSEDLITDQDRLEVAPALGVQVVRSALRVSERRDSVPSATVPLRMAGGAGSSRPGVSGKVVLGAPDQGEAMLEPHGMAPLPGQAPERPIGLVFDGGSKGNPGVGYGSYALRWPGQSQQLVHLQFGDHVTNNEAEYDTLIAALEAVSKRLQESGAAPGTARVEIRGDSLLVINQVSGEWKCTEERLRVRRDRARELLRGCGEWKLIHHPREDSVRVLGH